MSEKELVERTGGEVMAMTFRLKAAAHHCGMLNAPYAASVCQEAADLIEQQAARIAELEAALEPFANLAENDVLMDAGSDDTDDWFRHDRAVIKVGHLRRAASARGRT